MLITEKSIGNKNNKDIYNNLLVNLLPKQIPLYIEPFGGEFGLYEIMGNKPEFAIYNDINKDLFEKVKDKFESDCNLIYFFNKDYKEVVENYNVEGAFFYFDPPKSFNKEKHIELLEIIKKINGKFLLIHDDTSLVRKLYKNYNIYTNNSNIIIINY
jgi:site-specific DNA-adenine methylase